MKEIKWEFSIVILILLSIFSACKKESKTPVEEPEIRPRNDNPNFNTPITNAFNLASSGYNSKPHFVDIDNDGDFDLFVGSSSGTLMYYENVGSKSSPTFAEKLANPFNLTPSGYNSTPAFVDIDSDGDFDLFVGSASGILKYYKNIGSKSSPSFAEILIDPFNLSTSGYNSAPAFIDIDDDGDFDLLVGSASGVLEYYENVGSKSNPSYPGKIASPFNLSDPGYDSSPQFVDIDDDGDFDLFAGCSSGNLKYYENTGSKSNPSFSEKTTNPFNLSTSGYDSAPAFVDIDDDTDFDLFIGGSSGSTQFYRNTNVE